MLPADFPKFTHPPVNEVVLSAQFQPLEKLTSAHLGLLWGKFRAEYPELEQHHPIAHELEFFGPVPLDNMQPVFQVLDKQPTPRIWFKSQSGQELIQVQPDRFIHNWRSQSEKDIYPTYKTLRPKFATELASLAEFLADELKQELFADQCEVSYINYLPWSKDSASQNQPGVSLKIWPAQLDAEWLKEPEFTKVSQQFVIPGPQGPIGRLYVDAQPAYRLTESKWVCRLTLTARLYPVGKGIDGILQTLDVGHEWVVKSFAALINPSVRELWSEEK